MSKLMTGNFRIEGKSDLYGKYLLSLAGEEV